MTTSTGWLLGVLVLAGPIGYATAAPEHTIDSTRLANSAVRYRDQSLLSEFPAPVVYFRAAGLAAGPSEIAEIKEKVLYPLIERSRKPISAVVVQWFPGQPTGLGVTVLWSDGEARESTVARSPQGHYDARAYEVLFAKPTP
jgi:hypothetical protein